LGLEVRANDGTDLGRATDLITDGVTGEVTHLVQGWGGVDAEVAVSAVALDEDGEFATYSPDASDVEPEQREVRDLWTDRGWTGKRSREE
jgi:hypothetical protein